MFQIKDEINEKSLPWECFWYPTDRVPEIPHGNTDAVTNINTGLDAIGIYSCLCSLLLGRAREGKTDVEFGQSGLHLHAVDPS
jgi:hypothetical protein